MKNQFSEQVGPTKFENCKKTTTTRIYIDFMAIYNVDDSVDTVNSALRHR